MSKNSICNGFNGIKDPCMYYKNGWCSAKQTNRINKGLSECVQYDSDFQEFTQHVSDLKEYQSSTNADEPENIFKSLGFNKRIKSRTHLVYEDIIGDRIIFRLDEKTYQFTGNIIINKQLNEAVQYQIKDLGW
jgi:hypothetical protein